MKHNELFEKVTNDLVTIMETGTNPWHRSWKGDGGAQASFGQHRNAVTGRAYRGLNTIILQMEAWRAGYQSTGWLTPRQAMAAGLNIKGQKCQQITFWQATARTVKGDNGEDETQRGMFCKVYHVLNVEQCEGDRSALKGLVDAPVVPMTRHQLADAIASGLGLTIGHGGNRAFYAPQFDRIQMPPLESFDNEGAYCATLSHEAIHSTGAKTRLDRQFGARFGDSAYAFEELVAELGAAFVGAVTGHSSEVPNHASYLNGWLKILKEDSKAILTAASKAQAAADMVLTALSVETIEEEEAA